MKSVETSENKIRLLETKPTDDVNRILALQYEIAEIKEQLDTAIKSAVKKTYPKGKVVQLEKLVAVKEISETLSIKTTENESLVVELYHSIFPGDIFITQDYLDVWVQIDSSLLVKFADDISSIEVKILTELN